MFYTLIFDQSERAQGPIYVIIQRTRDFSMSLRAQ